MGNVIKTCLLAVGLALASCESEDACPPDNVDDINQMLPADCGCESGFKDECVTCVVFVDGEPVDTFNADCRAITCCGRS